MRPVRPQSPWAGSSCPAVFAILFASILPVVVGCGGMSGGPPPKTEAQVQNETKVQALLKEGKSLSEIRAIIKGEPLPKKGKKPSHKH